MVVLRRFGVTRVTGDRYAGLWPWLGLPSMGLRSSSWCRPSSSDLYCDLLPLLNAKRVELLDNPRRGAELVGLERRTARSGRTRLITRLAAMMIWRMLLRACETSKMTHSGTCFGALNVVPRADNHFSVCCSAGDRSGIFSRARAAQIAMADERGSNRSRQRTPRVDCAGFALAERRPGVKVLD